MKTPFEMPVGCREMLHKTENHNPGGRREMAAKSDSKCPACNRSKRDADGCSRVECPCRPRGSGDWGHGEHWQPAESPHNPMLPLFDKVDD